MHWFCCQCRRPRFMETSQELIDVTETTSGDIRNVIDVIIYISRKVTSYSMPLPEDSSKFKSSLSKYDLSSAKARTKSDIDPCLNKITCGARHARDSYMKSNPWWKYGQWGTQQECYSCHKNISCLKSRRSDSRARIAEGLCCRRQGSVQT